MIDLALFTHNCFDFVIDFKVISHAGSDHTTIELSVKVEGVRAGMLDSVLPLLKKFKSVAVHPWEHMST